MKAALCLLGLLLVVCLASAGHYGAFVNVDVDDEGVLKAAEHASLALSKQFAGKYHHRLTKVLKAKKQVVAGLNYEMDIIVGMTTCKKDEVAYEDAMDCEFQDNISTYKKCTVRVYRDLKNNNKLTSSGCILASKKDLE